MNTFQFRFRDCIKHLAHALLYRSGHNIKPMRVLAGPARGVRLSLDIRTQGSYWLGSYDRWIFDRVPLRLLLKESQTAWDCGAFVGYYTAIFRKHVGDRGFVYGFEASSFSRRWIKKLPELNGWSNVEIIGCAVGPDHTTVTFSSAQGGASGPVGLVDGIRADVKDGLELVQSCGIDELVLERGLKAPDFVKFDIETGEIFALKNGAHVFSTKRPVLLLELHGVEALEAALTFAREFDYGLCDIYQLLAGGERPALADPQRWVTQYEACVVRFLNNPPLGRPPHMTLAIPMDKLCDLRKLASDLA